MDIEKEIEIIKERNRRVELDKAWEISWTRRIFNNCNYLFYRGYLVNDDKS